MNIMIAAVGVDSGMAALHHGTAEGAAFVAVFAAVGFVLLAAAGSLIRGCEERPQAARFTIPRL